MPTPLKVRRILAVALTLAYPVLAHAASLLHSAPLTIASVAILAAAVLFPPAADGKRWAWAAVPLAALVIIGLARIDAAGLVLLLPPVLLNLFLAWLFGHTLARGSIPLIERLVLLLQPPGVAPEPGVIPYTRRLTQAWTVLFLLLAASSLVLAACATPGGLLESAGLSAPFTVRHETWSLFANVLNYGIVAAFFVLEYVYRRRRFPHRPYRNFAEFLRRAAAAGPALAASFGARPAAGPAATDGSFVVPADHPAFAGHFPGRPILPGVVLLERVIAEAERQAGAPQRVNGIPWVKFLAPLLPGDRASIRLRRERDSVRFEVLRGSERVAEGALRFGSGGADA